MSKNWGALQTEQEEVAYQSLDEGRDLKFQSKYDEAVAAFNRGLAADPNGRYAGWIYREKGLALLSAQRFEEAAQAFREAVRLDPHLDVNRKDLAYALSEMNNPRWKKR